MVINSEIELSPISSIKKDPNDMTPLAQAQQKNCLPKKKKWTQSHKTQYNHKGITNPNIL